MKTQVRQQLNELQIALRLYALWEATPPDDEKLASTQPFAIDTLTPTQWLQWIFLPRMHALLDSEHDLPKNFAITPYLEESLKNEPYLSALLKPLRQIEQQLSSTSFFKYQ